MEPPPLPRTLVLDYYDSYTNNLVTLLTRTYADADVLERLVVVKADEYTWDEFQRLVLPNIDCVILSPGPGRPDNPADIGFALQLLRLHPLPILGVCLGHQAIGVAFGGKIINTPKITHGHVIPVAPVQPPIGLFASPLWKAGGETQFDVVVYNSLTIDPMTLPQDLEVTAWSIPSSDRPASIQGLRHRLYPIWGVQYHPESISSTCGSSLLISFLNEVHKINNQPTSYPNLLPSIVSSCAYRVVKAGSTTTSLEPSRTTSASSSKLEKVNKAFGGLGKGLTTEDVFQRLVRRPLRKREKAVAEIWLDGQTPTRPTTSSLASPSFLLTYSLTTRTVTLHRAGSTPSSLPLSEDTTFWDWFSAGQEAITRNLHSALEPRMSGWRGGWVGWFAYEMKEESLRGYRRREREEGEEKVDACWGWTDRFLERTPEGEWVARGVVRQGADQLSGIEGCDMLRWLHKEGIIFGATQDDWVNYVQSVSNILDTMGESPASSPLPKFHPTSSSDAYQKQIDACREAIRQGESYELTLTTSFSSTPLSFDPFALYLHLRKFNPAYYSTYMSFPTLSTSSLHGSSGTQGIAILSSSPERFLKIDSSRQVEMMPIKGTRARVKEGQCVCQPGVGCERENPGSEECRQEGRREDERRGKELVEDVKERAENLMIVDLIRSDLLSCCIPSTVTVPKLIALESYGVHNLVTTVQGTLADNVGSVEAVKRCFPPGSMTGAPKLRSVQLLDEFENHQRRGIYSGALGYFSVDGVTDLSVVIRTIVVENNRLSIGAGGAITWLSDREKEWDEVLTKVKSVVGRMEDIE
ncbi:para-aminobenzoate synthetase [Cryptococcus neoformans c45]|nr:para-aminobenzoate synthetase [Cryptococcus neoformans var. grubii c45]